MLTNPYQKPKVTFYTSGFYQQLQLICRLNCGNDNKKNSLFYPDRLLQGLLFSAQVWIWYLKWQQMLWMGLKAIYRAGKSLLHIGKLCDSSCQPPERFDKRQTGWLEKWGQLFPIMEEPFKWRVLPKTGRQTLDFNSFFGLTHWDPLFWFIPAKQMYIVIIVNCPHASISSRDHYSYCEGVIASLNN